MQNSHSQKPQKTYTRTPRIVQKTFLNLAKIDSFKLRFPISWVSIVNNSFNAEYQKIFLNTGEIEPFVNLDKHKVHSKNGITFSCGIAHYQNGTERTEYIYLKITAKMLQHRYFLGISKSTIKTLYDYVMSLKIIDINYNLFLKGLVSDVDICFDYSCKVEVMQKINNEIYRIILPSKYRLVGKPFARKNNTGLQFNVREKATPKSPYFKIYHKTIELTNKSEEFAIQYLKPDQYQELGRVEYTIKNSRHKKALGIKFATLDELLEISQKRFKQIIHTGIPMYTLPKKSKNLNKKAHKELGPKDALLHGFLKVMIEKGFDKTDIYSTLNLFKYDRLKKYRMKKIIDNLIDNVDDKKTLIENAEVRAVLKLLKLDYLR